LLFIFIHQNVIVTIKRYVEYIKYNNWSEFPQFTLYAFLKWKLLRRTSYIIMNYAQLIRLQPSRVTPSRHTLRGERLIRVSSGEPSLAERARISQLCPNFHCMYLHKIYWSEFPQFILFGRLLFCFFISSLLDTVLVKI
jgi:hypothetical protein